MVVLLAGVRNLKAGTVRKILYCVSEREMVVFHHERDRCAARPATKAVIELLSRADGEGRRFLVVKWTSGLEVLACLFQWYMAIDNINHVDAT